MPEGVRLIVVTPAYGLCVGCSVSPNKHRNGSWIQTSRRRHGERPCGLISRYGSAGELRAWRPILWDTRPLMGVFRGITPGL